MNNQGTGERRAIAGQPTVHIEGAGRVTGELVARLRAAAERLMPYSEARTLLRQAAGAVERLDRDVHSQAADIARLTRELERAGISTRS
jgi:hypothetical protein